MSLARNKMALTAGAFLVLLAALFLVGKADISQSNASSDDRIESNFSALTLVDKNAEQTISDETQTWLGYVSSTVEDLGGGELRAIGESELKSGTATVADFGSVVCISSSTGASNCGNVELALQGKLIVAIPQACTSSEVFGLMPDGVQSIEAESAGEGSQTIAVVDNLFEAELPAEQTRLTSDNGAVIDVALPLDNYAAMNGECAQRD